MAKKTTTEEILETLVDDSVAKKIADKPGEPKEGGDQNTNAQGQDNSKANEPTNNEIPEEDIALLLEAGLTEQELTAKSVEEIQQLIKEKKEGQQKPSPIIITQDIAEQLGGIAKSFVGKDITELFKALDEQNSYIGKLSNKLKQLESELTSKPQVNQPEVKSKEDVLGLLQADELEKIVEKVLSKRLPNIDKLKEVAVQEQQKMILNNIQSQLGEGYNAQEVIKQFAEEMAISDEDIAFYESKPQRFIRDVVDYVKRNELAKELEEIKKKKSYEEKLEVARKIRQVLNSKTADTKGSSAGAEPPSEKPEYKTVKEILESL